MNAYGPFSEQDARQLAKGAQQTGYGSDGYTDTCLVVYKNLCYGKMKPATENTCIYSRMNLSI